jgi:Family of unknown function (DUF6940)
MYRIVTTSVAPSTLSACISFEDTPLTFAQVFEHWERSEAFCREWIAFLAAIPFDAYCWETPPLRQDRLGHEFRCVFVASPALAGVEADPEPFATVFRGEPDQSTVQFENLGGDALLVAPCPSAASAGYAHLASFARCAGEGAARDLWRAVGVAVRTRIGDEYMWLSTAGLGVYWLHVRIDTRPKYYRYRPYTDRAYWQRHS